MKLEAANTFIRKMFPNEKAIFDILSASGGMYDFATSTDEEVKSITEKYFVPLKNSESIIQKMRKFNDLLNDSGLYDNETIYLDKVRNCAFTLLIGGYYDMDSLGRSVVYVPFSHYKKPVFLSLAQEYDKDGTFVDIEIKPHDKYNYKAIIWYIRKKDNDRNFRQSEVIFNRNCTYRADIYSARRFLDTVMEEILPQMMPEPEYYERKEKYEILRSTDLREYV